MEKLSYQEAKDWFWTRTWLWLFVAMIASVVLHYFLPDQVFDTTLIESVKARALVAVGMGVGSVVLGLLAVVLSMELPWMRLGWRMAFFFNALFCAFIAAFAAAVLGVFALAAIEHDPYHLPPANVIYAVKCLGEFFAGSSALWGAIFGVWFALRRDKYFVEHVY